MPKVQLFEVNKLTSGKATVEILSENGELVVIREDLTFGQAKAMAARLNGIVTTAEKEYKPTRREQKFSIHFEGDVEITSCDDAEEFGAFYSAASLKKSIRDWFESDFEPPVEGMYDSPKTKVTVTKVYDKQVPNE